MSKGVQTRLHNSRSVILAGTVYADVVSEAWLRHRQGILDALPAREEHARVERWLAESSPSEGRSSLTLGHIFRFAACDLEAEGEAMLAHDETLVRRRAEHRTARSRRNQLAKKVYRELSDRRRFFMGILGHRQGCDYLDLEGPTPRDPGSLLHWARVATKVLADPEKVPPSRYAKEVRQGTAQMALRMEALSLALHEAIKAAIDAEQAEIAAIAAQRTAIKRFDLLHKRTAHLFEATLDYFGLPSLAGTVRPGVKRRGRPRKQLPVDVYPDLVARVLGKGYRWRVLTEAPGRDAQVATVDPAAKEHREKIETGSHEQEEALRKIETAPNKLQTGERKIEIAPDKLQTGERKIETGRLEQQTDDQKSGSRLCKQPEGESSQADGRLTEKRPVSRRRRRIVHGLCVELEHLKPNSAQVKDVVTNRVDRPRMNLSNWL